MDENLYFHKEVIEKYEVDKILTPVNLGDGELANVSLSDLRKELDLCYAEISNSITFKEKLLAYLEDYTLNLRALLIPQKKNTLKFIKRKRKKLTKEHPNLDDNDDIIEEISNITWEVEQENYIFHYLKELPYFIRVWVNEKRKEDKDEFLKDWVNEKRDRKTLDDFLNKKQNKHINKSFPFYCQVGALFAQGFISKSKFECIYNDGNTNKIFDDISKLSKYVKEDILKTENVIRPYINDTLSAGTERKMKDFYKSKKMMEQIVKYCTSNNISITTEFQSIHDNLIK